ncbi:Serine/threonine-protein kinase ssp1 [Sphaceloma murrayae]|uniref:Serine/threonine-protein kinase ssp1 n=1 Tax=Sphaceloma murrayae TaxID=2082308 RepID=A0A2K1QSR6_9PEZI|nr:Serine/threonine-protein kinase ssp1 [Sphaceloma murrayae]
MYDRQRPQPIRVFSDSVTADLHAACLPITAPEYEHSLRSNQAIAGSHATPFSYSDATLTARSSARPAHVSRPSTVPLRPSPQLGHNGVISPPSTPPNRSPSNSISYHEPDKPVLKAVPDDLCISTEGGELLGSGLWSNVYKVTTDGPLSQSPSRTDLLTPPTTPQKATSCAIQVYAVKTASRPDAREVFQEEARTLAYLQRHPSSPSFIIPFHGIANANTALIFTLAPHTLETYVRTTPPPSLLSDFPKIYTHLISGLTHLHALSLIHADIKPANILLSPSASGAPLARYADFSASFLSDTPVTVPQPDPSLPSPASSAPVSRANSQRKGNAIGGGTYGFMAPEQLSANPVVNEPSYASDVYALGMTLLTALMGAESPYREMEQGNVFLYREAVKMGDAIGFAKRDAGLRKRLGELEAEERGKRMLDGVKMAVKKGRAERICAEAWRGWALENLNG